MVIIHPQQSSSIHNCQATLSLLNSVSVQLAPSLLQVGSSNPAYDKIFDHLKAVKYKGEGSLLLTLCWRTVYLLLGDLKKNAGRGQVLSVTRSWKQVAQNGASSHS